MFNMLGEYMRYIHDVAFNDLCSPVKDDHGLLKRANEDFPN